MRVVCGDTRTPRAQSRWPSGGRAPRAGRGHRPPGRRLDRRPGTPIDTAAADRSVRAHFDRRRPC